jgi:hypothetical protein
LLQRVQTALVLELDLVLVQNERLLGLRQEDLRLFESLAHGLGALGIILTRIVASIVLSDRV